MQGSGSLERMILPKTGKMSRVIKMKTNKEILSSILKTTQMGQVGIRSILDTSMRPGLRKALESQLQEYASIENEAHAIASQRGWELPELDPGARFMSEMMTRAKLAHGNADSKIAGMMIQGNTRGISVRCRVSFEPPGGLFRTGRAPGAYHTLAMKGVDHSVSHRIHTSPCLCQRCPDSSGGCCHYRHRHRRHRHRHAHDRPERSDRSH